MFTSKNLAQVLLVIILIFGVVLTVFAVLIRDDIKKCEKEETQIAYNLLVSCATVITIIPIIGLSLIHNQYAVGNLIIMSYVLIGLASSGVFYSGIIFNGSDNICASKYSIPVWITGAISFFFSIICIVISYNYDTKKKYKAILKYEKNFREELDKKDLVEVMDKKIKRLKKDEDNVLVKIKDQMAIDPKYRDKKLDTEERVSITKELLATEASKDALIKSIEFSTKIDRDNLKKDIFNIYDDEIAAYTAKVAQLQQIKNRVDRNITVSKVEKAVKSNEPVVTKSEIATNSDVKPVGEGAVAIIANAAKEVPINVVSNAVGKHGFLKPVAKHPFMNEIEMK